MKLFLAGTQGDPVSIKNNLPKYILESFYYIDDWQIKIIPKLDMFLLDSGAFTFMNKTKNVNFDEYLTNYINFINKNDIKYFFELDIDSVVGYEKVKSMRKRLEKETGKKCIPVWHKERGLEEWIDVCKNYDYVAIGGIVTKEIQKKDYAVFKGLNKIAKQYGTKVHGLGFTSVDAYKYGFYSVDSTSWLSCQKYGGVYKFDGKKMKKISTPKNKKTVNYKIRNKFIIQEWIKYQQYLERF